MNIQIVIALLAGMVLPIQAIINGRLATGLGGAFIASNISFIVAALVLIAVQLALGKPFPTTSQIASVPPIYWLGGALGAIYVTGAITSVGHLGATSAICLIIAGQILGAIVVDHFGILTSSTSISPLRAIGAMAVLGGAVLVVTN